MKFYIRILGILIILLLLWTLYRYLSKNNIDYTDLSPIDRCSLKYDRDRVYEFDNLLTESECNQIIEIALAGFNKKFIKS